MQLQQFFWFTFPGTFFALGAWLCLGSFEGSGLEVSAASLTAGFVLNQGFRLYFETKEGYFDKNRPVFVELRREFGLGVAAPEDSDDRKRWLSSREDHDIFHMALYSNLIPSAFREHNRGSWHYWMGLRTCEWACRITVFLLAAGACYIGFGKEYGFGTVLKCERALWMLGGGVGFVLLISLFRCKQQTTKNAIDQLEIAFFRTYSAVMVACASHILDRGQWRHMESQCLICRSLKPKA